MIFLFLTYIFSIFFSKWQVTKLMFIAAWLLFNLHVFIFYLMH